MDEYEEKTPLEWQKLTGITIIDPDGWRIDDLDFSKPISRFEWTKRMLQSTCQVPYSIKGE